MYVISLSFRHVKVVSTHDIHLIKHCSNLSLEIATATAAHRVPQTIYLKLRKFGGTVSKIEKLTDLLRLPLLENVLL